MSLSSTVGLVLAVFFFLLSFVDGAAHGHNHRHGDKVIARATISPLSLAASTVVPAGYGPSLRDPVTPCSGFACATAVPTSSHICPASNETAWTDFPTAQDYTVICEVDFPAQNIYPFVLAGSFEGCMAQCESYNAKNADGDIHCEGFVFAPERIQYADDCYLKSALDRPFPATIPLMGATKVASFSPVVATKIGVKSSMSEYFPLRNPLQI
jgi:hypothetical protein